MIPLPFRPAAPIPADVIEPVEYCPAGNAEPIGAVIEPLAALCIASWRRRRRAAEGAAEPEGQNGNAFPFPK